MVGDPERTVVAAQALRAAGPGEISFCASKQLSELLGATRAGAVIVDPALVRESPATLIVVEHPTVAFARVAAALHPARRPAAGVAAGAHVDPSAQVHPTASVGPGAVIERGAQVGARTLVAAGAFIGEEAVVGDDCTLHPGARVLERCIVGARVILHASCVIGADGFGFAFDPRIGAHVKVPQLGIARVEDDVEIGACTCVDRATFGETVIGRGSKLDNLVQVAHNVRLGPLAILCAQVGVSGSSEVGAGVVLAGQVGVAGHLKIGDGVQVAAQSGIAQDVPSGARISGTPAIEHRRWLRAMTVVRQLGELQRDVKRLKATLEGFVAGEKGQKEREKVSR